MEYDISKKLLYSGAVFCDDKIIVKRRRTTEEIPIEAIEEIQYKDSSFFGWLFYGLIATLSSAAYERPGIMYIYYLRDGKRKMCAVKPKKNEVYKLPIFYKVKMGLCEEWKENRKKL